MHAQIVLFDGFDPLDAIAPYEVLYAGGAASDGAVRVELVSAEGRREVISGTGDLGRHATTHHLGPDALEAAGAHVVRARVVDDGDLVTGAGVTSGLDLGIHLLEREVGPKVALAVEELFAYERRGVVWRNHGPKPSLR
ncbi:hypothetical protein ACIPXV_19175 [Streptomyces libani]|uniref:hypothetical protein n=1 Tax=Streptomyces nigrescens TaxID=1920 RepID=UPI00381AF7F8